MYSAPHADMNGLLLTVENGVCHKEDNSTNLLRGYRPTMHCAPSIHYSGCEPDLHPKTTSSYNANECCRIIFGFFLLVNKKTCYACHRHKLAQQTFFMLSPITSELFLLKVRTQAHTHTHSHNIGPTTYIYTFITVNGLLLLVLSVNLKQTTMIGARPFRAHSHSTILTARSAQTGHRDL